MASGEITRSKIAGALAKLLGCRPPPAAGDPLGEDGAIMRELKERDSQAYERIMDDARKAHDAHRLLDKIRGRDPTPEK